MKKSLIYLFVVLFAITGCDFFQRFQADATEEPLARVNNHYLYPSEVFKQYPENLSEEDSIFWIKNIVNAWIRKELLINQAEKNLTDEQKDFSKQITDYRNSLLVYEYENRLIDKELDTVISKEEIIHYYNENPNNFKLKRNIVKAIYFSINILPERNLKEATKIFKQKSLDIQQLEYFCSAYHLPVCHLDTSVWVYFDEIQQMVPIKTYNEEAFLRYNRSVDFRDGNQWYFVYFYDFLLKEESVPLELEENNIRNIIINRRKTELIRNIRKQIYDDAEKSGEFEVY